MIPLGAWLIRQLLKLFKKRLRVRKLINIYGYALIPRLVVAAIGSLILARHRAILTAEGPSTSLIVLIILGLAGIIYTLVLYVYGIVVSPSEES